MRSRVWRRLIQKFITWTMRACFVITLVLIISAWIRSYWVLDDLSYQRANAGGYIGIVSSMGSIMLANNWNDRVDNGPVPTIYYEARPAKPHFFEVGYDITKEGRFAGITLVLYPHSLGLYVPYGYLLLLPAVSLALCILSWRRQNSVARAGHCRSCGYDLRATPQSCPECGATPGAAR